MVKAQKTFLFVVVLALVLSLGLAAAPIAIPVVASPGTTYYVNVNTGNDGNDGLTPGTAWKTITHAVNTVPAGTSRSDPNIIQVAAGSYNAGNETFPITFEEANIALSGAGNTTTIIVGDGTADILVINHTGITVEEFNITNTTGDGIDADDGGFTVLNNTFWNVSNGINFSISATDIPISYFSDYILVRGNTFNTTDDGIYIDIDLDYDGSVPGLTAASGDADFVGNVFYIPDGCYGINIGLFVYELNGGDISLGAVNMSGNRFYNGSEGIDFYGDFYNLTDTTVAVGDMIVNGNTFVEQTGCAVYMDYYDAGYADNSPDEGWYGDTAGTYGDLVINNNNVTSTQPHSDGIYVSDIGYWRYFGDDASLTVGSVYIEGNNISVDEDGIYLYAEELGYNMSDDSSVEMGDVSIQGNTINISDSDYEGIYIEYYDYIGSEMYDNSAVTLGDILVNGNTIDSSGEGIHVEDMYDFGYDMNGNSAFEMGNIEFNNNDIVSEDEGMCFDYLLDCFGYEMYDGSSFTMGDVQVNGNEIYSDGDCGIYAEYIGDVGYYMYDNSNFEMGDIQFNNNDITSYGEGIYLYYYEFGYEMYDDSSFVMGDIQVNGNTINSTDDYGVYLDDLYYFGYYMYENSAFEMGDVEFNNNDIVSYDEGLYLEDIYEFGEEMEDDSSFTMGDIQVNGNTVTSTDGDGIYIYEIDEFGYVMYNNSKFEMGNIQVNRNTINSSGYGMYVDVEYLGDDLYNYSSFTVGDVEFSDNTITSGDDGMYLDDIYSFGETIAHYSSYTLGDILINNNVVTSGGDGICVDSIDDLGYEMNRSSTFTMGSVVCDGNTVVSSDYGIYFYVEGIGVYELEDNCTHTLEDIMISNNTITSGDDGIYIYDICIGYDMYDDASLTMGDFRVNDNIITSGGDGINLSEVDELGYNMYDDSSLTMGDVEFRGNTIVASDNGTYLNFEDFGDDRHDNSLFTMGAFLVNCNVITNCDYGVYVKDFNSTNVTLHINYNDITGSSSYGIYNDVAELVDGRYNWWGDASGPFDPNGTVGVPPCSPNPLNDKNADGGGDKVSNYVDYCPWLKASAMSAPTAAFSASRTAGMAPLKVDFTDESTGGVVSWLWDFGDGATSEEQNPSHSYTMPGSYTVVLTVTTNCGKTGTGTESVRVAPMERRGGGRVVRPASFVATYLQVLPPQVNPDEPVDISINIANTGGESGSHTVTLYINGDAEQSQTVSVSPGSTKEVVFTVTRATSGTYNVVVEGLSGEFVVVSGGISGAAGMGGAAGAGGAAAGAGAGAGGGLGTGGIIAIVVVVIALIVGLIFIFRGREQV